jgi:GNAT superfamily N-acetyltransferase
MKIVNLTPENAKDHSFFCIKNIKEPGFEFKERWFRNRVDEGLKLKVIYADDDKQVGFIEYVPAEFAWRPVEAEGWMFIHCIMVYPNKYRSSGTASMLINEAIAEAKVTGRKGVCTMTSQGAWMAAKKLFIKNGFEKVNSHGRFELMAIKLQEDATHPKLINWENKLRAYKGWHLVYADQCPWHDKGIRAIALSAKELGIKLKVNKIQTPKQAREMPSGFGVFALIKDGKLLEDHYISKRRFESIAEKELTNPE